MKKRSGNQDGSRWAASTAGNDNDRGAPPRRARVPDEGAAGLKKPIYQKIV